MAPRPLQCITLAAAVALCAPIGSATTIGNDGYLDYADRAVPRLSTQTLDTIYISRAFQLDSDQNVMADIYGRVSLLDGTFATINDGEYIRATFFHTLDNTKDITVHAKPTGGGQPASIEVYPVYIDAEGNQTEGPKLTTVSDGANPDFGNIDHCGKYRILLSNLQTPTDIFDLKVSGAIEVDFVVDPSAATGGTITEVGGYCIHTFTTVGTSSFTVPDGGIGNVEVLVVGGGGGGGSGYGGGGGAGGFVTNNAFSVTGGPYVVTVGAGGAGGAAGSAYNNGIAGSNSVFGSIVANGGGYGSAVNQVSGGGAGGSGGGAGGSGVGVHAGGTNVSGQGHNGGSNVNNASPYPSGGGGGAGAIGGAGSGNQCGAGGDGLVSNISGSAVTYAGGGGGGRSDQGATRGLGGAGGGGNGSSSGAKGGNGTANTGGGGGGGGSSTYGGGGNGGSGIVIVRYLIPPLPPAADAYSVNEESILTVAAPGVLTNDPDPGKTALLVSTTTHGTLTLNANGSFTYTPATDYFGSDQFTYRVSDDLYNSATTVSLTVNSVNDAPSFTKGSDVTVLESAVPQTISGWATAISAGPPNESWQAVSFEVSTDRPAWFTTQPAVASDGMLIFYTAADSAGSATVQVRARDNGGTSNGGIDSSAWQSFTITITNVNDAPSFTKGSDVTVLEGAGPQTISGWATAISAGPSDEPWQVVSFEVSTDRPAWFTIQPAVASNGTLSFYTAADSAGSATVQVRAHDNGGTSNNGVDSSAWQSFTITITNVNDVPSFTKGSDVTVLEDAGAQTVAGWATAISAGPPNESGQTISFELSNNRNGLFSAQPSVSSAGVLTFTPAADSAGSATVQVRARDNGGTSNNGVDLSAWQSFTITVTGINDAPSFTKGADKTVWRNAGPQTVATWAEAISAGPPDESGQSVLFETTVDNTTLFSSLPAVTASGTLTFTVADDSLGEATVQVRLLDDGGTVNGGVDTSSWQSFKINVALANRPPSFVKGSDVAVNEDAGLRTFSGWATAISAGPAYESYQTVTFEVSAADTSLFLTQPTVSTTGMLSLVPAANVSGSTTVTIRARDNGGTSNNGVDSSAWQSFTITITEVNDAPSFAKGSDITTAADQGPLSYTGWATAISPGPAAEGGQTVSFELAASNPALFTTQPAISSAGTLTFESRWAASGYTVVQVRARDNGGTANGGVDTSAFETFVITITAVDHSPSVPTQLTPLAGGQSRPGDSLTWSAATDPDPGDTVRYVVQVSASAAFSSLIISDTLEQTRARLNALPGHRSLRRSITYHWRVKAIDNTGLASAWAGDRFIFSPAPLDSFSLASPASGADVADSTPQFSWNASGAATPDTLRYRFDLFSGSVPDSLLYSKDSLTTASWRIPATAALADNSTYRWRVTVLGIYGDSLHCRAPQHFFANRFNEAPGVPLPLRPADNAIRGPGDTLWWTRHDPDPGDTLVYAVQVATAPVFSAIAASANIRGNPYMTLSQLDGFDTLVNNRVYYWRVRATDPHGLASSFTSGTSYFIFERLNQAPLMPFALSPAAASVVRRSTVLRWRCADPDSVGSAPDTLSYTLIIDNDADFSSPVSVTTGLRSDSVAISAVTSSDLLTENSYYYWKVHAVDNHGSAGPSTDGTAGFWFNDRNETPQPVQLRAAGSAGKAGPLDTLRWSGSFDPDPLDTLYYIIEIGPPGFASIVSVDTTTDTARVVNTLSGFAALRNAQSYAWRVRAFDRAADTSDWSAGSFIYRGVVPLLPDSLYPADNSIVYPNGKIFWRAAEMPAAGLHDTLFYIVAIAGDRGFTGELFRDTIADTAYVLSRVRESAGLRNHTAYYWRIACIDNHATVSGWSPAKRLLFYTAPDVAATAPKLIAPQADEYVLPGSAVTWRNSSDPDDSVITYRVEVATDSGFGTVVAFRDRITQGDSGVTTLNLTALEGSSGLVANAACFLRVLPSSLIDTMRVPGNVSATRRFWIGSASKSGNAALTDVTVITPVAEGGRGNVAVSTDKKVQIVFRDSTVLAPIGVAITRIDNSVPDSVLAGDSVARAYVSAVDSARQYALGDNRMWFVNEPAYALIAFYLSAPESTVTFRDSVYLQLTPNDTNSDGLCDADPRIKVSDLRVCRLNEKTTRWEPVVATLDTSRGFGGASLGKTLARRGVSRSKSPGVMTPHFSVYSLLAFAPTAEPFSDFKVYPSPFRVSEGKELNIAYRLNEDADVEIRIFSKTGGLVWKQDFKAGDPAGGAAATGEIQVHWDLRNGADRDVSSDAYLVKILARPVKSRGMYRKQQLIGIIR